MSKRSNFAPRPKDFWRTPKKALAPLLPHLPPGTKFAEPCAGDGTLVYLLEQAGHKCVWKTDMWPAREDIGQADALMLKDVEADYFLTNPPWRRDWLHPIIDHLSVMLPFWALFDADWCFTKQSSCLIHRCSRIIPVGRVKWIPDSPYSGMDSVAWYEFLPGHTDGPRFIGYPAVSGGRLSPIRNGAVILPSPAAAAPAPVSGPSASDLLARLRGNIRPMAGIPTLSEDKIG